MWSLSVPWWELPLRALFIYVALVVMMRLSGKRTVGQFTPFDLLVVLLLAEAAGAALKGDDTSITGSLLSVSTLIGLNVCVAAAASRSAWVQTMTEGEAVLIGRDGKIFKEVLKREHVPVVDLERALREADCDLKDMKFAFLEADGVTSILKTSSSKEG
ncbi:DUF421 domain-containing protein [Hydrogenophaga sp.]|uniref:DUF421 domain-containing protein n=1 Tax=Hydrogenophaga sp. TaxID=1904254 RepID=UPI003F71CC10